jgi:TetR/AcrR family transcriptional regulator, transcriptional repressor for nem operon
MARPRAFDQDTVLVKAMHVFWAKGYAGTSLDDLVDAMGINRQSIYNTFGDKHALFMRCLALYWQGELDRVYAGVKGNKAEDRLRSMMHEISHLATSRGEIGCMLINSLGELAPQDQDVMDFYLKIDQNSAQNMANRINAGQESGEFDPHFNPFAAAKFLIALSIGIRTLGKVMPANYDFSEIADFAIDVLKKR